MQGRLALLFGGAVVAGAAAYRAFRHRPPPPAVPEPHAEALKSELAASRQVVEEREEFEAGETTVDVVEPVPTELGDRRRTVHERGRQVAEDMRRGSSS